MIAPDFCMDKDYPQRNPTYTPGEPDHDVQALHVGCTREAWEAYTRISKRNFDARRKLLAELMALKAYEQHVERHADQGTCEGARFEKEAVQKKFSTTP